MNDSASRASVVVSCTSDRVVSGPMYGATAARHAAGAGARTAVPETSLLTRALRVGGAQALDAAGGERRRRHRVVGRPGGRPPPQDLARGRGDTHGLPHRRRRARAGALVAALEALGGAHG